MPNSLCSALSSRGSQQSREAHSFAVNCSGQRTTSPPRPTSPFSTAHLLICQGNHTTAWPVGTLALH